jgi:hypothetical protein
MKENELQSMGRSNQVWREIGLKQVLNNFDKGIQNLAKESYHTLRLGDRRAHRRDEGEGSHGGGGPCGGPS